VWVYHFLVFLVILAIVQLLVVDERGFPQHT